MIYEICWWLYKNNIPYSTNAEFKFRYRPDILCPTHVKPIIEVRYSETKKQTIEKFSRIPEELINDIIYVDANQEFQEKLIL